MAERDGHRGDRVLATFEEVVAEVKVDEVELAAWIDQNWVLPVEHEGRLLFDEADVARVSLIAELQHDLEVGEEAMPVVLRLLDQVYALRRALTNLTGAIKELPEETRQQLQAQLRKASEETEEPEDE